LPCAGRLSGRTFELRATAEEPWRAVAARFGKPPPVANQMASGLGVHVLAALGQPVFIEKLEIAREGTNM
jgi:hypothetical protein